MLEKQINGFIDYCKVSGFKDKSIESLSIKAAISKTFSVAIPLTSYITCWES